jgi:hypothetical protein
MKTNGEKLKALMLICVGIISLLPFFSTATAQDATAVMRRRTGSTTNSRNANVANPFLNDTVATDTVAQPQGIQYKKETPDSILRRKVFFFHYRTARPKIDEIWNPTLDPTGIKFCDPLDALNGNYYLGKGILGHSHVAIYPTLANSLDLQLQPDPVAGYTKRPGNIRLYQTMTPFTVLSYNSSLNKDYMVNVAHTQNVLPGLNVAFDYRLFCPEGVYTSSSATDHFLDATVNYFSRDSRIQASGGVIWQSIRMDENGGISDDRYFTQSLQSNRAGVPVNFYNMGTRQRELTAFANGSYSFVRQFERYSYRDSLVAVEVNDSTTRLDTIVLTDTIAAGSPRCLNFGTIGLETRYDRRKRVFTDSTWWQDIGATLYWTNDVYPDHRWRNPVKLTAGIHPHQLRVAIEGDSLLLRSFVDPFARVEVALGRGGLAGEADLRADFGEVSEPDHRYSLSFEYPFDSSRLTLVSLSATWQSKNPDVRMVYDYAKANGELPGKISSEHYALNFSHRDIVEFAAEATHLDHNVWYNASKAVQIGQNDLWLLQGKLIARLHVAWMHLDMQQLMQYSTDADQMPVPLWASKNSIYADFHMFHRSVRAQIGADIRYHTPFYAPAYDPATGLFHHQDETKVGGYIWADLFININVKRASFYVKGGHINALWDTPNYFLLPHYPGQRLGLFWGITWLFFD